mmetsp:Transcript_41755/g.91044  ORF Transcript_41755/g.91044 Transcript_41755/m.91044 type:complete len:108 (-) Transcript_41755:15-338(-)
MYNPRRKSIVPDAAWEVCTEAAPARDVHKNTTLKIPGTRQLSRSGLDDKIDISGAQRGAERVKEVTKMKMLGSKAMAMCRLRGFVGNTIGRPDWIARCASKTHQSLL